MPDNNADCKPENQLYRLANLMERFDKSYSTFAKTHGETYHSMWALEEIGLAGGSTTQKYLAEKLHLPKQTISAIVASFEKRGLVETKTSELDRRSRVHSFTRKGQETYGSVRRELDSIYADLTDAVGESLIVKMNDTLSELVSNFDAIANGKRK